MSAALITAAINGAEVTRDQYPSLPLLPAEVGEEAGRCVEAGAAIIHLHGRKPDGTPTQDLDTFRAYFEAIRSHSEVIVQFSTGGAVGMDVEERIVALALRPDMATLTTGTVNFGEEIFENPLPTVRLIAERLRQFEIRPEIEVFDVGMLDTARRLVDEGILKGPLHVDFVLGVPGAMAAEERHLDYLVSWLPPSWTWCVAGIGRHELRLAAYALERGGHVRVGVEDNLYVERGVLAKGTWELVERAAALARAVGREPMSVDEARAMLRVREPRYPVG
ncbi:MAG: 3-keto-5-aminohexanoate cleavage protein [Myxococcales bacterium]|nr:3-keto-5-aminohexanoate cleavage protein [Myxococcales bacterium]MCB9533420.1 3-keto-5-aminohexanoate cleavage protein [Myxococcales bacterium]